jgi:hypothetical protein
MAEQDTPNIQEGYEPKPNLNDAGLTPNDQEEMAILAARFALYHQDGEVPPAPPQGQQAE